MLHVESIYKNFGQTCVLKDVSFTLNQGDIGCLLGASGCGKTTLLRIVAGFEQQNKGDVSINGTIVSSATSHMQPEHRNVGMVFQDYALFPHLTVRQNIAFGLTGKKQYFFSRKRTAQQESRIDAMIQLVGLGDHAHAYPHELSGGQQQRVALARAIAPKPKLLLMDEPFSNLDITLRERLSVEMRSIIKKEAITALMVTHNQSEAFAMGDSIGIMNNGTLHQWASPVEVYQSPATPFVASFIGEGMLVSGKHVGKTVETVFGTHTKHSLSDSEQDSSKNISVLIRPEHVALCNSSGLVDSSLATTATIDQILFRGAHKHCRLKLKSGEYVATNIPFDQHFAEGQQVCVCYNSAYTSCFKQTA